MSLELYEVHSPADDWWCAGFFASCFRPAVERKTDISTFTKLLNDVRSKEPVTIL